MNGIDLLRRLRAEGSTTPVRVRHVRGLAGDARPTAEAAGALFLIAKPFTADAFREVIDPVLA